MNPAPLVFRSLAVRRMPGITDGGWDLPDLSGGVNVVWGPNGAGKTTTARAIEHLLWPGSGGGRPSLDARLAVGGDTWRIALDGGDARCQCNGQDAAALPGLPPASERDRYRLSLHDLLNATDSALAARILHESAGGFDVARASESLGFHRAPRAPLKARDALAAARRRAGEIRDAEGGLRQEEDGLRALRDEADARQRQAREKALWVRALERLDAHRADEAALEALEAFPATVARLHGGEAARLCELRAEAAAARERARTAAVEVEAQHRAMRATKLPEEGLPADLLERLEAALEEARVRSATGERLERELEQAREQCRAEQAAVAGALGEEAVASLDLPAVDDLLRFAREAEAHRAAVRAGEAELEWLRADGPPPDPEPLARGRALLSAWLRLAGSEARRDRMATVALASAAMAGMAGAIVGWLLHPAGWALLFGGVLLGWIVLSDRATEIARAAKRREYERLGLEAPVGWEPEPVAALADRLEAALADARERAQREERRRRVEGRLAELAAEGEEIGARRAALAATLGLAPDADEAAVAWLCQRVHRWQVAYGLVRQKEEELRAAKGQERSAFARVAAWTTPFGVAEAASPAELAGVLAALRARREAFEQARARGAGAEARLRAAEDDAARHAGACTELLAGAGLEADGDARLEALCALRPEWIQARDARLRTQQDARTADRRLAETAGFEPGVLARSRAGVEEALAASEAAENEATRLAGEVARVEERLRAARNRTDMEDALAAVDDAEAALRACRARDEAAVVGWALREHVERETRDRDRPAVFHRARTLFAAITRGRYRLELSDGTAADFRAVDTGSGAGFAVDELSRGTRVQLLLAVRIAFIETLEGPVHLPLVLDEALGNSDDERAEAVMDAVIELARGGRQIFILTARADEVDRWERRLSGAAVDHRRVDLAEARRISRFADLPRPTGGTLRLDAVPAPDALDHAAYGKLLRVSPVQVDADGTGADAVHLWYLTDDPALLHRLLSLGAETWGSLRTLVEHVGPGLLGADEAGWARLEAMARAMARLLEARRVGRGRRVDVAALQRSGAVTPAFEERVEAALHECAGRPELLLDAVENLPRFRGRAQLRDFLEAEGYLDAREPLGEAQVREELVAALAPDLRAGVCTIADLERLLWLVPAADG